MVTRMAVESCKACSGKATYKGMKGRRRTTDNFFIDCGQYDDEFWILKNQTVELSL
jgi:hypothetical protein